MLRSHEQLESISQSFAMIARNAQSPELKAKMEALQTKDAALRHLFSMTHRSASKIKMKNLKVDAISPAQKGHIGADAMLLDG
jgi:hypothetical protein